VGLVVGDGAGPPTVGEAVGSGVPSGFGDGLTDVPPTSVALTTSTRNCGPAGRPRPRLISTLPVASGLAADAGAMAADPGVGCDVGCEPDPSVGAEPGVGELVEDPSGAGEVEPVPLGESVGVPVPVPVSVGVGLALGVPVGVPVGIALGEPDGEQLVVPVGCDPPPDLPPDCPDGPAEPLPGDVNPGEPDFFGCCDLVGAGGLTDPPVFLPGAITAGSAATANDAAVTTNRPVPTAAAGRSQPNHPARFGSGRNRSATAATTAGSQPRGGSKDRHHGSPAPRPPKRHRARPVWPSTILARILASPSAPGSTDSAAANRAVRSALSCSALPSPCPGPEVRRRLIMRHAPAPCGARTSRGRCDSSPRLW
jgi:hypothetical protein